MILNFLKHRLTKSSSGMTLVEVMITTGIFLMITGLIAMMVIKGKTMYQAAAIHAATRQEMQTAFWKIAREVQASNTECITDGSSVGMRAFSFISGYDRNGTLKTSEAGYIIWQKFVIYYIPSGTTRLLRKEVYQDFTANPQLIRPLTTAELASACNGEGNLISPSALSIKLTPQSDKNTAELTLELGATSLHGTTDKQLMTGKISIYNNKSR